MMARFVTGFNCTIVLWNHGPTVRFQYSAGGTGTGVRFSGSDFYWALVKQGMQSRQKWRYRENPFGFYARERFTALFLKGDVKRRRSCERTGSIGN
jgi:hypothetical protein